MRTLWSGLLIVACTCGPGTPDTGAPPEPEVTGPAPVDDLEADAVALRFRDFAVLEIPDDSRPEHAKPPELVPLQGPWTQEEDKGSYRVFRTDLPVKPRGLFFSKPPYGSMVQAPGGEEIPHVRNRVGKRSYWTYNRDEITLFLADALPAPGDGDYRLYYPVSIAREAALNFAFSGKDEPAAFVRTLAQSGPSSYAGLLLPAPATVAWDLEVPPAGELRFMPGLLSPEIADGPPSDGALLVVTVTVDGTEIPVWEQEFEKTDVFDAKRVDLSQWAGKDVRLAMKTEPGDTSVFDYIFVADPVLASRKKNPRHVVLVFVDTLRPDHLSLFGYERATSPSLDALAQNATVFENARSVAPWTLPSTRSMLTGRHPEYFDVSGSVQQWLAQKGWATGMFAGNLYLAPNFGLHRDWGKQHVVLWPIAKEQVDWGLEFLEEQEGRDALLLLHFMDAHLPYIEPDEYRHKFAGEPTHGLGEEFHRTDVLRARIRNAKDGAYIVDRYDNNILYTNDELQRVYDVLDENDVVIYLADHGEEFWEHRGYEHGHTLYDEVLRIPLVIKAKEMKPGRVSEPVSMLDVVPTLMDIVGVAGGPYDGRSLVPVAAGDAAAKGDLLTRSLPFGRPLYGSERWGVLHDGHKWTVTEGKEALFDLSADPTEDRNLLVGKTGDEGAIYRSHLAEAVGRPVGVGYRVVAAAARTGVGADLVATLKVPGGISAAWVGDDPTSTSSAAVTYEGDEATITWHRGFRGQREVYVVPKEAIDGVTPKVRLSLSQGKEKTDVGVPENPPVVANLVRTPFLRGRVGTRWVTVTLGIAPIPDQNTQVLSGYDSELSEMLQAMGYAVGDDDEAEEEDDSDDGDDKSKSPQKPQRRPH